MTTLFSSTVLCIALFTTSSPMENVRPHITVGSKKFTESVILGEIIAHLARYAGGEVNHRRELGGSRILSDALLTGGHPNPRSYGTFPYVLGQLVREEGVLRLEEAVRKMTAIPAQRLGLSDRGILRDGMKADIVMFDPHRVAARATFEEPKQYPEGIDYVMVNGQLVIDNGVHTGAMSGRALRSQ